MRIASDTILQLTSSRSFMDVDDCTVDGEDPLSIERKCVESALPTAAQLEEHFSRNVTFKLEAPDPLVFIRNEDPQVRCDNCTHLFPGMRYFIPRERLSDGRFKFDPPPCDVFCSLECMLANLINVNSDLVPLLQLMAVSVYGYKTTVRPAPPRRAINWGVASTSETDAVAVDILPETIQKSSAFGEARLVKYVRSFGGEFGPVVTRFMAAVDAYERAQVDMEKRRLKQKAEDDQREEDEGNMDDDDDDDEDDDEEDGDAPAPSIPTRENPRQNDSAIFE